MKEKFNKTVITVSFSFLAFLIFTQKAYSQVQIHHDQCGTHPTEISNSFYNENKAKINNYKQKFLEESKSTNIKRNNEIDIYLPVKVHVVSHSDGSGGVELAKIQSAIDQLNLAFDDIGLAFFICEEINDIQSTEYYNLDLRTEENSLVNSYLEEKLINMFIVGSLIDGEGNGIGGLAHFPGGYDAIYITNNYVDTSLIVHEMGHFFSLQHTHGISNTELTTELVDGSNCNTAGDEICDTPADPLLGAHNVNADCNYFGNTTDANGHVFTPDPSNYMSYAGINCINNFTQEQYARMYAVSRNIRNYFECPTFKADFTFEVNASCNINTTAVTFSDTSIGATSWFWDIDSDGTIDYTNQNPTHNYTTEGNYTIKLIIQNSEGYSNVKTYSKYIPVGTANSLPFEESFDNFSQNEIGAWSIKSYNNYQWYLNSGLTEIGDSGNTGPLGDHSSNNSGNYFYAKAAPGNQGDETHLISPCIQVNSTNASLTFAYHMYGINMGELHVDIDEGNGFVNDVIAPFIGEQQGNQSDPYELQEIDLSSYSGKNIRIRFRAVRGDWWFGDIAIDSVTINNGTLSSDDFFQQTTKVYPNPTENTLFIKSEQEIENIRIYNLLGKLILNKKVNSTNLEIDLRK